MGSENGTHENLMRIGDLAKRTGLTMRTIRYYEERGLIQPAQRTKGGFRLYEESELRRLHLIRSLQLLDMPLAKVKAFFDAREPGRSAADIAPTLQGILREHFSEMENRLAHYRAMQESVRETLGILDVCCTCPYEPAPKVCRRCPAIASRGAIPVHMQAVIEFPGRADGAPANDSGVRAGVRI